MRTILRLRSRVVELIACCALASVASASGRILKVCADPNNLPFSNRQEHGFENRIVEIVARELNATLSYVWWAQRRGNIRETLDVGLCDVIPGVASDVEMLATTRPYYSSTYVFVTRAHPALELSGFDDERLRRLTIGVQMIGDDFANTPPAHALARRGIVDNVRGYMVYGDYAKESPLRAIVDDVAKGVLDVAIVWGPLAGYFAQRAPTPLKLQPVSPQTEGPALPMTFSISMGVRRGDRALLQELNEALARSAHEIDAVLQSHGIPTLEPAPDR
jgi:mxaJ protein